MLDRVLKVHPLADTRHQRTIPACINSHQKCAWNAIRRYCEVGRMQGMQQARYDFWWEHDFFPAYELVYERTSHDGSFGKGCLSRSTPALGPAAGLLGPLMAVQETPSPCGVPHPTLGAWPVFDWTKVTPPCPWTVLPSGADSMQIVHLVIVTLALARTPSDGMWIQVGQVIDESSRARLVDAIMSSGRLPDEIGAGASKKLLRMLIEDVNRATFLKPQTERGVESGWSARPGVWCRQHRDASRRHQPHGPSRLVLLQLPKVQHRQSHLLGRARTCARCKPSPLVDSTESNLDSARDSERRLQPTETAGDEGAVPPDAWPKSVDGLRGEMGWQARSRRTRCRESHSRRDPRGRCCMGIRLVPCRKLSFSLE